MEEPAEDFHHRLPTPSLRQQYFNFRKAQGEKKLGTSFSLPNLSENHTYLSPDVQVLTLEELSSPAKEVEITPPRQTPLRSRRFGSSVVPPERVKEALPKQRLVDDLRAVRSAHNSLEHLAKVTRDFERIGRRPEVNAALPHRRMRGLDLLYSVRNDSSMLPKPEDEGGVRQEDDEETPDGTRQKAFKLLRSVPYFKTLETAHSGMSWKLSRRCEFFQEAAGQVVFRQGDPAGNCYVLIRGEVAVKIFKPSNEEDAPCPSPREDHEPRMYWYETLTQHAWAGYRDVRSSAETEEKLRKYFVWADARKPAKNKTERREIEEARNLQRSRLLYGEEEEVDEAVDDDDPERDMSLLEQLQQDDNPRFKTAEGHRTWCPKDSCLGETVVTLSAYGTIFGEMALQNDKDRAATIECTQDCEFMVIPRFVYRRILKELTSRSSDSLKAVGILRQLDFFREMEAERPGVCDRLAMKLEWQDCPPGQVIFRQRDPPGNCYVLCEGTTDVYICSQEFLPQEGEKRKVKNKMTPRTCLMYDLSQLFTLVDAKRAGKGVFTKDSRFLTLEKFSSFDKDSMLGKKVASLDAPAVFGELALKNTQPRAATIACKTACRLMILEKNHLMGVLTDVMARIHFFNDRLPGVTDGEYRIDHPSKHFSLRAFPQGFQFMYEGIVMTEPAIYVLKSGTVEFKRYRRVSHNPAYVLSHLPLVESSWKSRTARPRTGVAGSQTSKKSRGQSGRKHTPREDLGEEVVCDIMEDEGVFCTLPFFPLHCVEPFSVVASSPIEVFHAGGQDVKKIAADSLASIRKHLLWQLKERIRKLPEEVAESETAQMFDTRGETFYKTISKQGRKHLVQYKITYEEHVQRLKKQAAMAATATTMSSSAAFHTQSSAFSGTSELPTFSLGEVSASTVPVIPMEKLRL